MTNDEFTKLFRYIEEFRKEVTTSFEHVNARFDEVNKSFDQQAKLITDYHQEMLMLAHKVDRLERWIQQVAEKTGVKLEY